MPKIKVNGREIDVPAGEKLLKVLIDEGTFVPHYCWHPGLEPAGNCRMCLVKVSTSRKLEVACMYPCSEGMEVETEGPEVDAGRKAVLEYMLINHPLDCPICDKAGECDLQDFTYRYRDGVSRFDEQKVVKHTKDLGPNIRIWGNRCIVCTRCVRFCEEVTGTGELCVVNRGDHSVVDAFPGIPVDNPLSLNVVDICPVGALIDKNFMYSARVWFSRRTETVCASCSRGCNAEITSLDGEIKRMTPRANPDVNQHWLCDEGRLNTRYVASPRRLDRATGTAGEVASAMKVMKFAVVASPYQTLEELHLLKQVVEKGAVGRLGFLLPPDGKRQEFPGGFVIEADRSPNRSGIRHLFGEEALVPAHHKVVAELHAGTLEGLLVINGIPDFEMPADLLEAARKARFVALIDILSNPLQEFANVILPGAAWAEKDGTFMNVDGRIQRFRAAVEPPGAARAEVGYLQEMLLELKAREKAVSPEGVFREAFPGMDYRGIGRTGTRLHGNGA